MIQLFHVSKTYPPRSQALIDINLTIEQGEFVFLTGPSGAGKTTLMKLLFREEEPSDGQILVDGKNINRFNRHGIARLRRNIGLVFQEFKLLPRLSVIDNVSLAAEAIGKPRRDSQTKAYQLLRDLGLREKYEAKPMTLSGGEQQRVAIARALVNRPGLILADEPTGNLDSANSKEVMELLRRFNREQKQTILLVTHDPEVGKACSRIITMRDGKVTAV